MRPMALSRLRLVEELVDELLQLAAVAQELLEGPRQPAVAVREVGAQHLVDAPARPVVDGRRLGARALELAPDEVDVDRCRGVLEGQQADPQRALDHGRALPGLALGERRGEDGVREDEPLDDDPVAVDAHQGCGVRAARRQRRRCRQREDSGFHAAHPRRPL